MRNTFIRFFHASAAAAALMLAPALPLQAQEAGFYFNGALGGTFAQDATVKDFLGPVSNTRVTFDPGVHLGLGGGFNFNRWVGLELESGILANNINKLGTSSPDASLSHVPFLANVILRYDADSLPVVPYVGCGAGGDASVLSIDHSLGVDGSDSDLVFAFQIMTGVRYKINDRMSAGLGYKFYHADSASWEVEHSAGRIRFGETRVHAVSAVFNWKF